MKKQILKISIFAIILSFSFLAIPISVFAWSVYNYPTTNITNTSATLNGYFDVDGNRSFDTWFETNKFTTPKEKHYKGPFSKTITGFSPNTSYYSRACFERDGTTHCAGWIDFITLPTSTLPVSTTSDIVSNITGTTAKLNGSWTTFVGNSTSVWFQYDKDFSLTNSISMLSTTPQDLGGSGSTNQSIKDLELNTLYYFRIVTKNSAGTSYGQIKNFKTLNTLLPIDITFNDEIPFDAEITTCGTTETNLTPPTICNNNITNNISDTEATLRGSATPDTEPTTAYFRYSDETVPPIFCKDIYGSNMISTVDRNITVGGGQQGFFQEISGLQESTKYYYCAIVSSKNGIKYGEVKNFTTLPCPECIQTTVTTNNATVVNQTSAWLKGSYNSTKAVETYFEYKKDTPNEISTVGTSVTKNPWIAITSSNQSHHTNSYGDVSFLLSGLKAGTKYKFHLVAKTVVKPPEVSKTFYGGDLSFTTKTSGNGQGMQEESDVFEPQTKEPYINQGGVYNQVTTGTGATNGSTTTTTLTVGQNANAPSDAIVHYHEGIETVFARQIIANPNLAKRYGYAEGANLETFAWYLADLFARSFGYVNGNGKEIRVVTPDIAAYQLILIGNKLTVYEYFNGRIVNIQSMTGNLRNTYGYEYYFKK
ncbi:MAG: hypothetical protein WC264_03670 [Candidatus Paceibacterota bacterium]|jgi:hypothetical protein